jgi:hypothetical protein
VGYWLAEPPRCVREVAIKSFCLNCDYQFAVRALVRGRKTAPRRQRTALRAKRPKPARDFQAEQPEFARRPNYARELRAVGQDLERRGFSRFNLKCSDSSYIVWPTEQSAQFASADAASSARRSPAGFGSFRSLDNRATTMRLDRSVRVLFKPGDVSRLEREGVQSRQAKTSVSDGRRLSHLLRTIGEEVYRRNQRLLAVAWEETQTSVVAENVRGHLEMNVLRMDSVFDLWVRMYLRRTRIR